jgi:hypothetical protein
VAHNDHDDGNEDKMKWIFCFPFMESHGLSSLSCNIIHLQLSLSTKDMYYHFLKRSYIM